MKTEYTVDWFIQKFSNIPDELWCVSRFNGPNGSHCAAGHCGMDGSVEGWHTSEAIRLRDLFSALGTDVAVINDGRSNDFQQPTPRARILAALYEIKAKQSPPPLCPPLTLAAQAWPVVVLPQVEKVGVV